eukprot:TRINITY_DN10224_c0_g1_i1.p1 TRINITY_DN10224_c0_g1~~TRINITY_DN10224_c0_g1_i1.p1  ORF type:complete len:196 (-),score=44.41 TRINITY_DN10224_c0_g1_i1:32-619(-)
MWNTTISYQELPAKKGLDVTRYNNTNIGVVALFKLVEGDDMTLALATTHLFWNEDISDLKVQQASYFLETIEHLGSHPVIITGDFNSVPSSAVVELFRTGKLLGTHVDLRGHADQSHFSHSLKLDDVYESMSHPHTIYGQKFSNCVDYIWKTKNLELEAILEPPTGIKTLPDQNWPSDHISIGADLILGQNYQKE